MDSNKFGIFIKSKREGKGLTLNDLSKKIGYSGAYISMVENGKKQQPSYEFITALSKGLGVDYYELLHRAGYVEESEFAVYEQKQYDLLDTAFKHQQNKREDEKIRAKIEDDLNDRFKDILDDTAPDDNELVAKYLSLQKKKLPDTNKYYSDFELEYENETKTVPYFNLYALLSNNPNISYKFQPLHENDVKNIIKFIDTFIYKLGR